MRVLMMILFLILTACGKAPETEVMDSSNPALCSALKAFQPGVSDDLLVLAPSNAEYRFSHLGISLNNTAIANEAITFPGCTVTVSNGAISSVK